MTNGSDTMMRSDVAVVGTGPAGLSAALWLKNLGFSPWVFESKQAVGGMQNLNFLPNDWVLGQLGVTGPQLVERFLTHIVRAGVHPITGCRLLGIVGHIGEFSLRFATTEGNSRGLTCAALLIATGTRYRGAEVLSYVTGIATIPSERLFYGPHAFSDLDACIGRRVLIVGGGDNAYENARLLVDRGAYVNMALRSPPRAQQHLRDLVGHAESAGACLIHHSAHIAALDMKATGISVTLISAAGSVPLVVDRIHVLAGYEPDNGIFDVLDGELRSQLRVDAEGYLCIDAQGRTGAAGIYAAGDICNPVFPSVVSAIAQGAQAAKTIEQDLRKI